MSMAVVGHVFRVASKLSLQRRTCEHKQEAQDQTLLFAISHLTRFFFVFEVSALFSWYSIHTV